MRVIRLATHLGIAAAILLQAATSLAKITWDLKPTGTGNYDWRLRQHWRFPEAGASSDYAPTCSDNCNYHSLGSENDGKDVTWGGPGRAAPECLEVATYPGAFTSNPDTMIETYDSGVWRMVNDDFAGTWQSKARIWVEPVNTTMIFGLRVRAYSPSHNLDDFDITITRRDITKSQCTSGQTTIPWVQVTDSPALTVTLSSFH